MGLKALGSPIFMMAGGLNPPSSFSTAATLNATGESIAVIGTIRTEGGASKTISAAGGGRILWRAGSPITFSNAGTTIRVGIQDINSSGIEDGTFDVYCDYLGGTDTIAANTFYRNPMTSGTKTVSDGDVVAVVIEAVTRGGSDSIIVTASNTTYGNNATLYPYRTIDTGTGPSKSTASAYGICALEFDDGSIGFIEAALMVPANGMSTASSFGSSSTPDEYAACFRIPFKCTINSILIGIGSVGSADSYDVILYSDPFGTPAAIQTITPDTDYVGSSTFTNPQHIPVTPIDLTANTWYGVAARPTTTNQINIQYADFTSGFQQYKGALPFGNDIILAARTNQSGAFVEVEPYYLPAFGLRITHLDDGKYVYAQGQIGMN